MTREKSISALDIAEELNTGKATIKFILKRFKKWLPHEVIDGIPYYLPESIKTIIKILDRIENGILPGEIDGYLDTLSNSDTNNIHGASINILQNEDIRLNKEGVILLKSLFNELSIQQKRIAIAHEKRAEAEERKAVAIEKRAEAEEKKAEAMNNIANALQEMNRYRGGAIEPAAQKIAHQAAKAIIIDEADPSYTAIKMDDMHDDSKAADAHEEIDSDISDHHIEDNLIEGFSDVDEQAVSFDAEMEDPLISLSEVFKTDDLSLLIDNEDLKKENPSDTLDDLSALLEDDLESTNIKIDDLSALIDKETLESVSKEDLDDLTLLIDDSNKLQNLIQEPNLLNSKESMDDLTQLIPQTDMLLDDLSNLIDPAEFVTPVVPEIGDSKKTRTIQMDISPDDDIEKYKAAIMKVILDLKSDGFNAEETTRLLNQNMIRTLSGKPEWSQKAISQIYKFMTPV